MRPPRAAHRRRSGAKARASTPGPSLSPCDDSEPQVEPGSAAAPRTTRYHRETHIATHWQRPRGPGGNRVGCARPPHGGEARAPHLPRLPAVEPLSAGASRPGQVRTRSGPAWPGLVALLQASSARRLWRPARLLLNGQDQGPAGTRPPRSRPAGRTGNLMVGSGVPRQEEAAEGLKKEKDVLPATIKVISMAKIMS
jgi:hypothetical protein